MGKAYTKKDDGVATPLLPVALALCRDFRGRKALLHQSNLVGRLSHGPFGFLRVGAALHVFPVQFPVQKLRTSLYPTIPFLENRASSLNWARICETFVQITPTRRTRVVTLFNRPLQRTRITQSQAIARLLADDDGFIAIDALVGLTLLGVSLSLSFAALQTGQRMAHAAKMARLASARMSALADVSPQAVLGWTGKDQYFSWNVIITPPQAGLQSGMGSSSTSPAPCPRTISLRDLSSGKTYSATTVRLCIGASPSRQVS